MLSAVLLFTPMALLAVDDVVIYPGEQAVIHFEFDEPPVTDQGDPINFMAFKVGGSYVDFLGESTLEQVVRDGNQPLAMREAFRENGMSALFVSEDAAWSGEIMDFESVQDGSIQGVLVIRPVFDVGSVQSRVRFRGSLVTGRAVEDEDAAAGPDARIIDCYVDAPVFGDRFETLPELPRSSHGPRECGFGDQPG